MEAIDSEALDIHAKKQCIKDLAEKSRIVDELQDAVRQLEEEKQLIEEDYKDKMKKIEELWN